MFRPKRLSETIYEWSQLTAPQQTVVIEVHAKMLGVDIDVLTRIFNLGNPRIVIVIKKNRINQCRVHADSVDVMKLLIRNYAK